MQLKNSSLRIRSAEGSKGGVLLLLVTSAVWVSRVSKLSADDSADHPFVETKDLKSETCLKCHPTKNQGKFVHTAVGMGCEKCHQAASADSQTTITLRATGGNLCAKCHELIKDPVLHGPYRAGQCLICHNPHTGAYKAQARAAVNTLCLSCHMLNQPAAGVNAETKMVSLLDGRNYDLTSWERAPKIGGEHAENHMPGTASPPVIVKGYGKPGAEVNCLFCHDPHASKAENLLSKAPEGRGAAENLSLGYDCKVIGVNGGMRNLPVLQCPVPGGRL